MRGPARAARRRAAMCRLPSFRAETAPDLRRGRARFCIALQCGVRCVRAKRDRRVWAIRQVATTARGLFCVPSLPKRERPCIHTYMHACIRTTRPMNGFRPHSSINWGWSTFEPRHALHVFASLSAPRIRREAGSTVRASVYVQRSTQEGGSRYKVSRGLASRSELACPGSARPSRL